MFAERLQRIHERVAGTLSVTLVGRDGIPVESHNTSELDIDALAAELLTQLRAISDDHRELSVGPVRHFSVTTDRYRLLLTSLTEEYFLMMILDEAGNLGRARYELRRAGLEFEDDLI